MMISEVAAQAKVPRKFLEQILLDLKRRGIVRSLRGRQGGYLLGRAVPNIADYIHIVVIVVIVVSMIPIVVEILRERRRRAA